MKKRVNRWFHRQIITNSNLNELLDTLTSQFEDVAHTNVMRKKDYLAEPLQITLSIVCSMLSSLDKFHSELLLSVRSLHWNECMEAVQYVNRNKENLPFLEAYSLASQILNKYANPLKKLLKKKNIKPQGEK